jgi:phosphate transport system substrate-binding protein
MKKNLIYLLLFLISISCGGCARRHLITMAGSTAFLPFAEQLAEDYMKKNPGVNINVQGGGSAVGIQAALNGTAQIGMADLVTLPVTTKNLKKFIVANDGICFVVHPSNKIDNLATDQIRAIYSGKIKNWKELGGIDKPITVVSREAGSGTRSSFEDLILKNSELTGDAIIGDSNGTVREIIINDPQSIGYISHGVVNEKVKVLKINGIAPTAENIFLCKYNLVRPIYFLVKTESETQTKGIIDYILSPEGQKTILEQGLLPVRTCLTR